MFKRTANLLLIGLRGSGKSTLGRLLAQQTDREPVDLDTETLALLGASSVAEVFEHRGEGAFRAAEVEALRQALNATGRVVALGGGTPTAPGAADLIRDAQQQHLASVIYLRGSADTLRERLGEQPDPDRPSLTGDDPRDEMERVLAARDGLYRELADVVITIDGYTTDEVLELLLATGL